MSRSSDKIISRSPEVFDAEQSEFGDKQKRNVFLTNYEADLESDVSKYAKRGLEHIRPKLAKPSHKRLYPSFDCTSDNNHFISNDSRDFNAHPHKRSVSSTSDMSSYTGIGRTKRFSRFLPQHHNYLKSSLESDEVPLIDGNEIYDDLVGQEPGVNVDTMTVDLPESIGSQVTVIDYNTEDCEISHFDVEKGGRGTITGSSRKYMVHRNLNNVLETRPKWSKVRWIVVNGLSWEAIKPIAEHYKLHPLAVEDMLDIPQRTKMEIFDGQLFCCYPLHVLGTTSTPFPIASVFFRNTLLAFIWIYAHSLSLIRKLSDIIVSFVLKIWKRYSRRGLNDLENNTGLNNSKYEKSSFSTKSTMNYSFASSPESVASGFNAFDIDDASLDSPVTVDCIPYYTTKGTLCGDVYSSPIADKIRKTPTRSIYDWTQGNDVLRRAALQNMHISGTSNSYEITLEQVSLFMVGDTVISFVEKSAPEIYGPLENRLKSRETILRRSSDPSILIQAILDASVDLFKPIMDAYRTRLNKLQIQSLQRPNLEHTRALHAFMTDLTILRAPMSSIASTLAGLHSKCSASKKQRIGSNLNYSRSKTKRGLEETNFGDSTETLAETYSNNSNSSGSGNSGDSNSNQGNVLISEVAKLYFADVTDHALRYLEDLDDMRSQSNTLSSLIFNTISIHGSDYMKMLSLVSVVFLPLTFLTGYFGMNFKTFDMLNHDVNYYWLVAAPAAAILTAMVMFSSTKYQIIDFFGKAQDLL